MSKKVGKLVLDGLQKFEKGDAEMALISICVAADATAKREHPAETGNRARYREFLTDNIVLITFIATGGMISAPRSRKAPILIGLTVQGSKNWDLEEVIYTAVRCNLIHEGGLPASVAFGSGLSNADPHCLQLPMQLISGIILAVVASTCNKDQYLTQDYILHLSGNLRGKSVLINDFWGKKNELCDFIGLP